MALSAPNTPRSNFTTPRKVVANGNLGRPQFSRYLNVTPTSAKSKSKLNKENFEESGILTTPRKSENLLTPAQTPKCFNNVTIETPSSTKKRSSKEKFDELRNLTVAVRIRPMNARELSTVGAKDIVKVHNDELIMRANSGGNLSMSIDHIFQYDHIFWSVDESNKNYSSQDDVFVAIGEPLLSSAFRGYNACLFAYGQTGSGKSYSMMGEYLGDVIDIDVNAGITPRFCKQLFARISNLGATCVATVEVSYFEIYNEKIHDLLAVNNCKTALKVREHPVWGPYVVDLSVHIVKSYKELRNWLQIGNKNRVTAATAMNEKSSRSHSIFSIELSLSEGLTEGDSCRRSKVSLVDLAGSERLGNTLNTEHTEEKIRQGVCINKSLLTLGKVISALAEHKKVSQFVPYRDSVLTWLLRESLGGNSLTSMLATITPASINIDETLATLRYACQARSIVNRARINENPHDRLIRELRAEVERLRALRQDYERHSISSSIIQINDSTVHEQEMDDLRLKLSETEDKLRTAQLNWEHRFMETKQKQLEELAEAEKRKEELESHLRVITISDTDVNLSPYKSNFLEELEGMLTNNSEQEKKLSKADVTVSMNQIYEIMSNLRPAVDDSEENVKLLFARVNKLLQSFETVLSNSLSKSVSQKSVTFKL